MDDVDVLLAGARWSAAYYLCGYALECGLKACIARLTQQFEFPDKARASESYTHNLGKLVRVSGLDDEFEAELRRDADFRPNWATVNDWTEQSRYQEWASEPLAS